MKLEEYKLNKEIKEWDMEHFLTLARQGTRPNASRGEHTMAGLFRAIEFLADEFQAIDREAINGACELIKALAGPWDTEAQKQAAFALLEKGRK